MATALKHCDLLLRQRLCGGAAREIHPCRAGPEHYDSSADPRQRPEVAAMTSDTSPLRDGDAANPPKTTGAVSPEASAPPKSPGPGAPPEPPRPDIPPKSQGRATPSPSALATTRAAAAWFATAVALILLVLLIILILQNQDVVKLHYLGFTGSLPLGTALFLSLIHISEPTRLGMISYAVFCL